MPRVVDYRIIPFQVSKVGDSGRYVGRTAYWKLYAIENLVRVMINSILPDQLGSDWWSTVASNSGSRRRGQTLGDQVETLKRKYQQSPNRTSPGNHDIYYLYLPDLTKIIFNNRAVFLPVIPDIDDWIARIENLILPRNVVAHMNWLNQPDNTEIEEVYIGLKRLASELIRNGRSMTIP